MKFGSIFAWLLILALLAVCGSAAHATDQSDLETHRSCAVCGMDRKAYGYSRMLIILDDGGEIGTCSLHCVMQYQKDHKDRPVKKLLVADRNTRVLVEADKANWVMGGKKRGVMTRNPKWAFVAEPAAQAFVKANGGTIISWAETLAAAREETAMKVH